MICHDTTMIFRDCCTRALLNLDLTTLHALSMRELAPPLFETRE